MVKILQTFIVLTVIGTIYGLNLKHTVKRSVSSTLQLLNIDINDLISNPNKQSTDDDRLLILGELCTEHIVKINETLKHLDDCADKIDDDTPMCQAIPEYVECAMPVVSVLEDCLPEENEGVIKLIVESVVSVTRQICEMSGYTIIETLNPCLYERLDECLDELGEAAEKLEKEPITKGNVCSVGFTLRGCLHTKTELTCKNPKTRHALLDIYESVIEPCTHVYETNKVH